MCIAPNTKTPNMTETQNRLLPKYKAIAEWDWCRGNVERLLWVGSKINNCSWPSNYCKLQGNLKQALHIIMQIPSLTRLLSWDKFYMVNGWAWVSLRPIFYVKLQTLNSGLMQSDRISIILSLGLSLCKL